MSTELNDLMEHLERYRSVTLRILEAVEDGEMDWRPTADQYSLGQQLLHIVQTEDLYAYGLFEGDWNYDRVRFPKSLPARSTLLEIFTSVRERTRVHMESLRPESLSEIVDIPGSPLKLSMRSWLWFLVEHEMHHKAQAAVYLRLLGKTPPFYAQPLKRGERPDITAREKLGGF